MVTGEDIKDKSNIEDEQKELDRLFMEVRKASGILRLNANDLKKREEELIKKEAAFDKRVRDWESQKEKFLKRMEEDQSIFDKKFKILEMGFAQLNADKKAFESQKRAFEFKKSAYEDEFEQLNDNNIYREAQGSFFFKGVKHHLALKKRYKELIKIYHPDNIDGDKTMLQQINAEYEKLKKQL